MHPQMAIVCENTLSAMALRSLLLDMVPGIDVVCYKSVDELLADGAPIAHYFVSAAVLFHHAEFLKPYMRRTIVLTEGEASPFVQSGFRTIDVTATEQHIVRAIMEIHRAGHPSGHHLHIHTLQPNVEDKTVLSTREREVLARVVKGYINKEIAQELNISLATVIFHRNNISEKLKTRSIGRMTIYAILNNIVQLTDI